MRYWTSRANDRKFIRVRVERKIDRETLIDILTAWKFRYGKGWPNSMKDLVDLVRETFFNCWYNESTGACGDVLEEDKTEYEFYKKRATALVDRLMPFLRDEVKRET